MFKMKRTLILLALVLGFSSHTEARERILFNENWKFQKLDSVDINADLSYEKIKSWILPTGNAYLKSSPQYAMPTERLDGGEFSKVDFDDSAWRVLNLPHDWGIEGPFVQDLPGETAKLEWFGVAWYRKDFTVDTADQGKQFYLEIDGAMSFSSVWLNGELVGGWPYGYASYQVDLTPYIKIGEKNNLAIRLDNPNISSRWYPGGGIYRNVFLTKTSPVHVDQWGSFVTTPNITSDKAEVNLELKLRNKNQGLKEVQVVSSIFALDSMGKPVGQAITSSESEVEVEESATLNQTFTLSYPKLWDVDSPNRYLVKTELKEAGKVIDTYDTPFGVRTIEFTADDGFHLNGRRVQLNGVCMHHDHGALGAAFHYRAMERQIEILQDMGVNAIRTAHNPSAREMLEICDRKGILVLDEFVDTWIQPKKKNGYSTIFLDWHEQDLRAFMHRDRNHPSVIAWSTGNEVGEQHNKQGVILSKWLTEIVHQEDSTRPATIGNDNPGAGFNNFQFSTDVFGYNYKPSLYGKFKEANPTIPLYGSETASCISTRGEYLFPVENDKSGGKIGFFMSSYDLYAPGWACSPDVEFEGQDRNPASAGEFVWTGFDYLGEPTPFTADMTVLTNFHDPAERAAAQKELEAAGKIIVPSRSSYFGILDLAGFKKDRFYIYQANWRPNLPMAHILPHWNWDERVGEVTPVHVYTSGDEAELFLNGESLGRRKKGEFEYRLRWDDVVYQPGELKVVAYKNGQVWAEDIKKTAGKPTQLTIESDRKAMDSDGHDLIYVTVDVCDKEGLLAPRADNMIKFEVKGAAEIVATDNGDQTSHASFQNPYINAFNGKALVILRSIKGKSGKITLTAKSKGLKTSSIRLESIM